jgi:NADH-quinone oxidoreductase subunit C
MTNDELKIILAEIYPQGTTEEGGQWLVDNVSPADWHSLATKLRQAEQLSFDYLFCITCVDWKTHLSMVYHLTSTRHRHTLVIKSRLDRNDPVIDTVTDIWKTADFHEREVYEMFGVDFRNHPDLRKLILPDDWTGYPMRKDYEDPVNMIKL